MSGTALRAEHVLVPSEGARRFPGVATPEEPRAGITPADRERESRESDKTKFQEAYEKDAKERRERKAAGTGEANLLTPIDEHGEKT